MMKPVSFKDGKFMDGNIELLLEPVNNPLFVVRNEEGIAARLHEHVVNIERNEHTIRAAKTREQLLANESTAIVEEIAQIILHHGGIRAPEYYHLGSFVNLNDKAGESDKMSAEVACLQLYTLSVYPLTQSDAMNACIKPQERQHLNFIHDSNYGLIWTTENRDRILSLIAVGLPQVTCILQSTGNQQKCSEDSGLHESAEYYSETTLTYGNSKIKPLLTMYARQLMYCTYDIPRSLSLNNAGTEFPSFTWKKQFAFAMPVCLANGR